MPLKSMLKMAEPPPPEGMSVAEWDRKLQEGPRPKLTEGGKIEMEHKDTIRHLKSHPETPVEGAANMIAGDHEEELGKDYYPSLKGMEAALEQTKKAAFWDEMAKIALSAKLIQSAANKAESLANRARSQNYFSVAERRGEQALRLKRGVHKAMLREVQS